MEQHNAHLTVAHHVISTHFELGTEAGEADIPDIDVLRTALARRITLFLEHDAERLMHILYRIDVSEDTVQEKFRVEAPSSLPFALADLIIERQLAKAASHARYRAASGRHDGSVRNGDAHARHSGTNNGRR